MTPASGKCGRAGCVTLIFPLSGLQGTGDVTLHVSRCNDLNAFLLKSGASGFIPFRTVRLQAGVLPAFRL
jgi:hypothetical protein